MCSVLVVLHLETLSKTVVSNQDLVQTAHVNNKGTSLPNSIKSEVCDQNHQQAATSISATICDFDSTSKYSSSTTAYLWLTYEYDGAKQEQVYYTQQQHANAPPRILSYCCLFHSVCFFIYA